MHRGAEEVGFIYEVSGLDGFEEDGELARRVGSFGGLLLALEFKHHTLSGSYTCTVIYVQSKSTL